VSRSSRHLSRQALKPGAIGPETPLDPQTPAETRRKFDQDFREGAVLLVRETGKPIAQVGRGLGINEGTLGNWVNADKRRHGEGDGALSEDERAELARLRPCHAGVSIRVPPTP
jgi:transposase